MQEAKQAKEIMQITSKQFAEHVPGGRFEWHTRDGALFMVRPVRGSAIAYKIANAASPDAAVGFVSVFVKGFAYGKGDSERGADSVSVAS
jgi:hypothetical protein